MKKYIPLILFGLFSFAHAADENSTPHNDKPFGLWVMEFKKEAQEKGISSNLLDRAFKDMTPNERVIELDRKQPEGTKTFTQYIAGAVNDKRITEGKALMKDHKKLLDEVSRQYGVQSRFIVALWGIETNYGGYTGNFSIVEALATLAYDGRRSDFFRDELLKALQIIEEGHILLSEMEGSWAGAMGQSQFMPSSFLNFAVDHNKDGRKDIWGTLPDVFASIANYLKQSGWDDNLTWGREVRVPGTIDDAILESKEYRPLSEWNALGIRDESGNPLPDNSMEAALTFPGERNESAYLIYRNYDVILKWNRSRYFATAVGLLSDAIQ